MIHKIPMLQQARNYVYCAVTGLLVLFLAACGSSDEADRPEVGFVTNGIASFWTIADRGANAAAEAFDVEVSVMMPPDGPSGQSRMVQSLLARGVDGIAISPSDPENQAGLLNEIAQNTNLITHDSDAPDSQRLVYVGMDNYEAGRMCGKLLKEAMPEGGEVVLFIGLLGQLNADLRRQGVIDELMDRSHDNTRRDPVDRVVANERYTVLDTRVDQFDFARAKGQVEDALARYPELDAMIGLFVYNPPQILEAVREAGKLNEITIVGFDEDDVTLQAIRDGEIVGTVVQNPYRYGYESVRVLASLARGDQSVIPENQFIDIPARRITADNVDVFEAELRELLGN
ncbi:MAG: sugar-binding protein [Bacteroidetes bacterium]|nr:sugar-binding protein [Bacteroidota bacterium]MDE2673391.1 sugar-binding protein [Bacteroidota bacterium]